jgi:hypothetical protein
MIRQFRLDDGRSNGKSSLGKGQKGYKPGLR